MAVVAVLFILELVLYSVAKPKEYGLGHRLDAGGVRRGGGKGGWSPVTGLQGFTSTPPPPSLLFAFVLRHPVRYFLKFFFWLDVIAILSLVPDLLLLFSLDYESLAIGSFTVARAGRAARAAARAARFARMIKLFQVG